MSKMPPHGRSFSCRPIGPEHYLVITEGYEIPQAARDLVEARKPPGTVFTYQVIA